MCTKLTKQGVAEAKILMLVWRKGFTIQNNVKTLKDSSIQLVEMATVIAAEIGESR